MKSKIGNTEIEIIKGDITALDADAIVNPANNFLMHHGGLAAIIVKRGGMIIQEECRKIGNVPTGGAVITTGGRLNAKHVIHAVGPRYKDGNSGEAEKLSLAVISSLEVAEKKKLKSIAIPAISSGIFGYPVDKCAEVIVSTVFDYLSAKKKNKESSSIEKVILCLYDDNAFNNFVKVFENLTKK